MWSRKERGGRDLKNGRSEGNQRREKRGRRRKRSGNVFCKVTRKEVRERRNEGKREEWKH